MNTTPIVAITGPTTNGKSSVALMLARNIGGALINTDTFYLYASDTFHLSLGLDKDEPAVDIPNHLFGGRNPYKQEIANDKFVDKIKTAIDKVIKSGHTPILVGCSFTVNRMLYEKKLVTHMYILKRNIVRSESVCRSRVESMLSDGLIDEGCRIIEAGVDNSWIATHSVICQPILNAIRENWTLKELTDKITKNILSVQRIQDKKFSALRDVAVLNSNCSTESIVKTIRRGIEM